jgi:hypothetical protein
VNLKIVIFFQIKVFLVTKSVNAFFRGATCVVERETEKEFLLFPQTPSAMYNHLPPNSLAFLGGGGSTPLSHARTHTCNHPNWWLSSVSQKHVLFLQQPLLKGGGGGCLEEWGGYCCDHPSLAFLFHWKFLLSLP